MSRISRIALPLHRAALLQLALATSVSMISRSLLLWETGKSSIYARIIKAETKDPLYEIQYSIMAGFALEGVDYDGTGLLNISAIMEYRGKSYAIGGDSGAVTLANFVKHYNSNVQGASLGYHPAELCYGKELLSSCLSSIHSISFALLCNIVQALFAWTL